MVSSRELIKEIQCSGRRKSKMSEEVTRLNSMRELIKKYGHTVMIDEIAKELWKR